MSFLNLTGIVWSSLKQKGLVMKTEFALTIRCLNKFDYIDGLLQDCDISIANALMILQSCTKLWKCKLILAVLHGDSTAPGLIHLYKNSQSPSTCRLRVHWRWKAALFIETKLLHISISECNLTLNIYLLAWSIYNISPLKCQSFISAWPKYSQQCSCWCPGTQCQDISRGSADYIQFFFQNLKKKKKNWNNVWLIWYYLKYSQG